jgi:hypothetical protein
MPGERVVRKRFIQTDKYVVVIDVEMVLPPEDPDEPCYETETLEFIQSVRRHAECGDLDWLKTHGRVYVALHVN